MLGSPLRHQRRVTLLCMNPQKAVHYIPLNIGGFGNVYTEYSEIIYDASHATPNPEEFTKLERTHCTGLRPPFILVFHPSPSRAPVSVFLPFTAQFFPPLPSDATVFLAWIG